MAETVGTVTVDVRVSTLRIPFSKHVVGLCSFWIGHRLQRLALIHSRHG